MHQIHLSSIYKTQQDNTWLVMFPVRDFFDNLTMTSLWHYIACNNQLLSQFGNEGINQMPRMGRLTSVFLAQISSTVPFLNASRIKCSVLAFHKHIWNTSNEIVKLMQNLAKPIDKSRTIVVCTS